MREWPLKIIRYLTGSLLLSSLHCLVTALVMGGDSKTFLYSLIYLPVIILLSEGQKKVKHVWQFLIIAGAGIGLIHLAAMTAFDRKLSTVLAVLAAVSYFYARARKKNCWLEEPFYPFLALYIVMILLEMRYESNLLKNYAIYGAGVYYLLCMYKKNMDEMGKILSMSAELERFPMKRMFQSNYLMMSIQTVIVALGMCLAGAFRVEGVLYKFVQVLRGGIARLLGGLESEELAWGEEIAEEGMQITAAQSQQVSKLMEVLWAIGEVLGWIIVIGVTGYAVFCLLKKLYQLYLAFDMNSAENGDQIEQLYVTRSKDEKNELKKQRKESVFWDRSPNSRIRKIYKKRVLKEWKEVPDVSLTPAEIEEKISMGTEEKQLFHALYEKARYGKNNCTKEEVSLYKF